MSPQTFVEAPGQKRARQVVVDIKIVERKQVEVVNDSEGSAAPESQEFRNAVKGAIVGGIIGLAYGAATLTVIGSAFIPGVLGACLILGYSALGGVIFGSIIGSTGLFAKKR